MLTITSINDPIQLDRLDWLHAPSQPPLINEGSIILTTDPYTDLWQQTYYHFKNDNAPMALMQTDLPYFSFSVRCDFSDRKQRFDQCGIIIYQNPSTWLKSSVEYEDESISHCGCVVTNRMYSDWSMQSVDSSITHMEYRLSRRKEDFRIEISTNGINFETIRIAHLMLDGTTIRFGIYAASPEASRFDAKFSKFKLMDCCWHAHDGQQPDPTC